MEICEQQDNLYNQVIILKKKSLDEPVPIKKKKKKKKKKKNWSHNIFPMHFLQ